MKKKTISKLDLDLFRGLTKEQYNEEKAKYIAEYTTYKPGGFLILGYHENNPVEGEAQWNKKYPEGYDSWENEQKILTSRGHQTIIDKVNEIIEFINK